VRDLTGFILAGGKSTRMGEDKAFIELNGKFLLDHAMRRLKVFECDIFLVGDRARLNAFGRVIEDRFTNAGPLSGIHRALERTDTELNVITAVDVPLVPAAFLQKLVAKARSLDSEIVLPKTAGGYQPLCAVYKKEFFGVVDSALKAGRRKIDEVILSRPHTIFDVEKEGFSSDSFLNVNTPEDLQRAARALSANARAAKP
jgi:molybdenum cofactor guanylyltransferase